MMWRPTTRAFALMLAFPATLHAQEPQPAPSMLSPQPQSSQLQPMTTPGETVPATAPAKGAATAAPVENAKPKSVAKANADKAAAKPAPKLREAAVSRDSEPSFQAGTSVATAQAAEKYTALAQAGGWPQIPGEVKDDATGEPVALLRKRLAIEGDLDEANEAGDTFDDALSLAVKSFQLRMGLKPTGLITGATLTAINVPADIRARQLASSAQRISASTFSFAPRHVIVNIPSASVEAVENGQVVHRYAAIVGDVEHQSPQVSARIQEINLNPTWTLPTSIIRNEVIPKMQKNPAYLSRAKIRILDGRGNEIDPRSIDWKTQKAVNYTLRQDPGASNSLGFIRINMPNKEAVYLHDTPGRRSFDEDYRFLSHGCVRVEGVYDLAAWLLEGTRAQQGTWDVAAMRERVATKARTDIKLEKHVPVIWVYLTGWASADGSVHFRDDVYGLDRDAQPVPPPADMPPAPDETPALVAR